MGTSHSTTDPGTRTAGEVAPPLAGLRVLAVEQYGAGPFGTSYLADLGADVIKIENPAEGGDIGRQVGPWRDAAGESHFFHTFNRNKRSLTLDLKAPAGREVFAKLVGSADAVLNNLRGDLPGRLGLDHAALSTHNPRIVCVHLSAYGRQGPRAAWPGYDFLMQAEAGHLSLTGEPDGTPARYGLSVVDYMTGLVAAFGLLAAVLRARATGQGADVDTSLFDVALHNLAYVGTWQLNAGATTRRDRRSRHPSLVPSQLYKTADGWLFVMCNKEKFWRRFAEAIGRADWLADPGFASFERRLAQRDRLEALIDEALSTRTTAEWLERIGGAVPVAPVNDVAAALASPFVQDSDRLAVFGEDDAAGASAAPLRMLTNPLRFAGSRRPLAAAPRCGEQSRAVLTEAGLGSDEIDQLIAAGIVRTPIQPSAPTLQGARHE